MLVFLPKSRPIYKISAKEARCEAVLPKSVCLVFKIEGNVPCLRARSSHFVGHLPDPLIPTEEGEGPFQHVVRLFLQVMDVGRRSASGGNRTDEER